MASQNKINLIKIKNLLQNKNFKIGGFLNFKSDASEKIFKLCKTANQSLLILSFLNKPSDYQKYIKATDILISQNVYGGVFRLVTKVLNDNGVDFDFIDTIFFPRENDIFDFSSAEIF